jgi:FAD/FMN-containing dehydrogenase
VPFVTKSGGHSLWSTIGEEGIIIDLSKYSGIKVDASGQRATLRGSILSKDVAVALAEAGLFTGANSSAHGKN